MTPGQLEYFFRNVSLQLFASLLGLGFPTAQNQSDAFGGKPSIWRVVSNQSFGKPPRSAGNSHEDEDEAEAEEIYATKQAIMQPTERPLLGNKTEDNEKCNNPFLPSATM